jgi:hypothetical protein
VAAVRLCEAMSKLGECALLGGVARPAAMEHRPCGAENFIETT